MTRIAERKTRLQAETNAIVDRRPLVVLLNGHELFIRPKGRRHAFAVPYVAIYQLGAKLAAMEQRRLKAEKQHDKRKTK